MADPVERAVGPAEESRARELFVGVRGLRGPLAALRAAAESLEAFPDMAPERRSALMGVVLEEASRLGDALDALEKEADGWFDSAGERSRLSVGDLLRRLGQKASEAGLACEIDAELDPQTPDETVEVSFDVLGRAMVGFASMLRRETVRRCRLSARSESPHTLLDLAWSPEPGYDSLDWQSLALGPSPEDPDGGLRAAARQLGGEAWLVVGREGRTIHVRLLLPIAVEPVEG